MTEELLNIQVKIMPSGDEVEVDVEPFSTGSEIKKEFLDAGMAPKTDPDGNLYVYDLVFKKKNTQISDHKTLHDMGVQSGDTLYLAPKLVPGNH